MHIGEWHDLVDAVCVHQRDSVELQGLLHDWKHLCAFQWLARLDGYIALYVSADLVIELEVVSEHGLDDIAHVGVDEVERDVARFTDSCLADMAGRVRKASRTGIYLSLGRLFALR